MQKKMIPFKKKEKGLLEEGDIGGFSYKVYDRNNIQIYDEICTFRKDRSLFLDAIEDLDFEKMKDGDSFKIDGAGDTDPLYIYKEKGEVKIRLGSPLPSLIIELKKILSTK